MSTKYTLNRFLRRVNVKSGKYLRQICQIPSKIMSHNLGDPEAPLYTRLSKMESFRNADDGKFFFFLCYPGACLTRIRPNSAIRQSISVQTVNMTFRLLRNTRVKLARTQFCLITFHQRLIPSRVGCESKRAIH
jgi:hypothetical protein